MSLHSLPVFVKLDGRPVILIGDGEAAEAKRRLLLRAGATIVGEVGLAQLAIVALNNPEPVVARLKARGVLVNAVDRPDLCDFTLPAIVDRDPLLFAIGTGGASAGLAKALRQRLEALLPATLGPLAIGLRDARTELRRRWPDSGDRRQALDSALLEGGPLDALSGRTDVAGWLEQPGEKAHGRMIAFRLISGDPEELTLRQARLLGQADRIFHSDDVPAAILNRARADAARIACSVPPGEPGPGLSLAISMGKQ